MRYNNIPLLTSMLKTCIEDIRIYLLKKLIFTEATRPLSLLRVDNLYVYQNAVNNCFVIWLFNYK